MAEPELEMAAQEVTKIDSINIRAVENGFIVDVSGRDSDDMYASEQRVFLDKQEALDFMSEKIGG